MKVEKWENEKEGRKENIQGRWDSGTAEMKDMRPARPKNLATKTVAWPWASAVSIHCKQGRRIQDSLQPLRRTRQPLQLMVVKWKWGVAWKRRKRKRRMEGESNRGKRGRGEYIRGEGGKLTVVKVGLVWWWDATPERVVISKTLFFLSFGMRFQRLGC